MTTMMKVMMTLSHITIITIIYTTSFILLDNNKNKTYFNILQYQNHNYQFLYNYEIINQENNYYWVNSHFWLRVYLCLLLFCKDISLVSTKACNCSESASHHFPFLYHAHLHARPYLRLPFVDTHI